MSPDKLDLMSIFVYTLDSLNLRIMLGPFLLAFILPAFYAMMVSPETELNLANATITSICLYRVGLLQRPYPFL